MNEPNDPRPEVPVTTRRLRELPPSLVPARRDGIWNRSDRPKVVGILGWITVAIGYLSFILKGGGSIRYFSDMKWLDPTYVAPVLTRNQYAAELSLLLAEMAIGLLAIAGGLGTLKLREWGRRLLIAYALAALATGVLKAIYQFSSFDGLVERTVAAATQPIDRQAVENRGFFILITFTIMSAIWPLIVLSVATRRYVRNVFARSDGAASDDRDANAWRSN